MEALIASPLTQYIIHLIEVKIFDLIATILAIVIVIDGFSGEFLTPTLFDVIKWIVFAVYLLVYIVSKAVIAHEKKQ